MFKNDILPDIWNERTIIHITDHLLTDNRNKEAIPKTHHINKLSFEFKSIKNLYY